MRRAVVLLTAVLLAAPTALVAAPGGPDAGLDRYRQGHVALAGGDFAAALGQFESVPPDSILADYAAFFAAETLLRAGDEAPALERFRVFLERFPDSVLAPQAVLALADTAFRLGRWAEGEREARRFLKLAPQHPEAGRILVRLAVARAAQGWSPRRSRTSAGAGSRPWPRHGARSPASSPRTWPVPTGCRSRRSGPRTASSRPSA
jgi:tetratricopeptide (TPR) repeat protein